MVIAPDNSSVIYTGGYIYNGSTYVMTVSKSTDGGTTWERDTLTTAYSMCYALAIDRSNSNVVYAGGYNGYLFKTTNGGVSWFYSSSGLSGTVYDIKIASTKANTVYAGTSSGVYKSTNAGASWSSTGLSANVNAVLINPSNENEIYAATSNGIYKSTTGGGGWTLMNTGLLNTNTTSLGIYANNWLFCGTNGTGMYRWNIQVGAEEAQEKLNYRITVHPNPCVNGTKIQFTISKGIEWKILIFDVLGREVQRFKGTGNGAAQFAEWNLQDNKGNRVRSGVYFYKFISSELNHTGKIVVR